MADIIVVPSGGGIAGNTGNNTPISLDAPEVTPSGGGIAGNTGNSTPVTFDVTFIPSGGGIAGNTGNNTPVFPDYVYIVDAATALIRIETASLVESAPYPINEAIVTIGLFFFPSGLSKEDLPQLPGIDVESGSFLNPAIYKFTGIRDIEFLWNIRARVLLDLEFIWNVGQLPKFHWRVVGTCRDMTCPPFGFAPIVEEDEDGEITTRPDPESSCTYTMIVNVTAATVEELCARLKAQNWIWPIETVHKFSKPAENEAVAADEANGIDHSCNVLELVDVCSNSACFDFCIDFDVSEKIGVITATQEDDAFFAVTMEGGITWKVPGTSFGVCADVVFVPFTNTKDFFYTSINEDEPVMGGCVDVISSAYVFVGGVTPCDIIIPGEETTSIGVLGLSGPGDLVYGAYPSITPDTIISGPPGIVVSGTASIVLEDYFYVGGVWPFSDFAGPQTATTAGVLPSQGWLDPENAKKVNDSIFAVSNLSFLKNSQDLILADFQIINLNTQLPTGKQISNDFNVLGIQIWVWRKATLTVRDAEVFFIFEATDVSDNLAKLAINWPTINSITIYGNEITLSLDEAFSDPTLSTNSEFGVRLSAEGFTDSGGVSALVDGILLQYKYEHVGNNQTVRTGGSAVQKTEFYTFVASEEGSIFTIGGSAFGDATDYTYVADPMGLFPPDFASLFFFGTAGIDFNYVAVSEDDLVIEGEAIVHASDRQYVAITEDIILESNNNIIASAWSGNITGESIPPLGLLSTDIEVNEITYFYSANDGDTSVVDLKILKLQSIIKNTWEYTPELPGRIITVSGEVLTKSPTYFYFPVLGDSPFVNGFAFALPSDFEATPEVVGIVSTTVDLGVLFTEDEAEGVIEEDLSTISRCNCSTLPLKLFFRQNLAQGNILEQFLLRNDLTFPSDFELTFNLPNNSWQTNFHLQGISADTNTNESWNFIFELKCTNVIGGTFIAQDLWVISVLVIKRNLTTFEDFDTRILIAFDPTICLIRNVFDIQTLIDTQAETAIIIPDEVVNQLVVFDNIGLFKNPFWERNSNLFLRVSEAAFGASQERVNLDVLILT